MKNVILIYKDVSYQMVEAVFYLEIVLISQLVKHVLLIRMVKSVIGRIRNV